MHTHTFVLYMGRQGMLEHQSRKAMQLHAPKTSECIHNSAAKAGTQEPIKTGKVQIQTLLAHDFIHMTHFAREGGHEVNGQSGGRVVPEIEGVSARRQAVLHSCEKHGISCVLKGLDEMASCHWSHLRQCSLSLHQCSQEASSIQPGPASSTSTCRRSALVQDCNPGLPQAYPP